MSTRLRLAGTAPAMICGGVTRVLVPPGRLLTFHGEDATTARTLLEQAAVEVAMPARLSRAGRIATALVEHGALLEIPDATASTEQPDTPRVRVLYCVTEGADAVRGCEYVLPLAADGRFEVAVVLDDAAMPLVNAHGLRWLLGIPVHVGLFAGDTAVHSALGAWADVVAVLPASVESLRRLAAGRYCDLVAATVAASAGKVALFSSAPADGGLRSIAESLAAEGFVVVPGDPERAGRVALTPSELPDALRGFARSGAIPAPVSEQPRSREPRAGLRIVYGISGAIVSTCSSAWLESLVAAGGFEVAIVATDAASQMVSVQGLRSVYGGASTDRLRDASELAAWADLVVVLPATAEFLCRVADRERSDLLASTVAAADNVVLAPSMNSLMWSRRAVQNAVDTLAGTGTLVLLPGPGFKASDRSAPPGLGGIGVAPASLPGLLRLVGRLPRAPGSASD